MPCSPARLAANRRNARSSTGPRTLAGKERSRQNAVKHGMTGQGVALPTEDAAAVAARFEAIRDELAPQTVLGCVLVKRVALLSVRLDRSERVEAAALASRVEAAEGDFDEARTGRVNDLLALLEVDPADALRKLRRMPEGVDRLIGAWAQLGEDLGDDLRENSWGPVHREFAERLSGRAAVARGESQIMALFRASCGIDDEGRDLDDGDRRAWAVDQLREIVEAHLADLQAHRATLDPDQVARDRARAADRALFDPSKESVLARKYEAAAERALFRTLAELREVEAEAEARAKDGAESGPEPGPLGSFLPDAPPAGPGPTPEPPIAPTDADPTPPSGRPAPAAGASPPGHISPR